jgi:hypothetical protein
VQNSIRGSTMSSANFVWPVHFARASTLRKGLPTTLSGFPLLFPFLAIAIRIQPQINADERGSDKEDKD